MLKRNGEGPSAGLDDTGEMTIFERNRTNITRRSLDVIA
jgi:hypothetical protein